MRQLTLVKLCAASPMLRLLRQLKNFWGALVQLSWEVQTHSVVYKWSFCSEFYFLFFILSDQDKYEAETSCVSNDEHSGIGQKEQSVSRLDSQVAIDFMGEIDCQQPSNCLLTEKENDLVKICSIPAALVALLSKEPNEECEQQFSNSSQMEPNGVGNFLKYSPEGENLVNIVHSSDAILHQNTMGALEEDCTNGIGSLIRESMLVVRDIHLSDEDLSSCFSTAALIDISSNIDNISSMSVVHPESVNHHGSGICHGIEESNPEDRFAYDTPGVSPLYACADSQWEGQECETDSNNNGPEKTCQNLPAGRDERCQSNNVLRQHYAGKSGKFSVKSHFNTKNKVRKPNVSLASLALRNYVGIGSKIGTSSSSTPMPESVQNKPHQERSSGSGASSKKSHMGNNSLPPLLSALSSVFHHPSHKTGQEAPNSKVDKRLAEEAWNALKKEAKLKRDKKKSDLILST